MNKLLVLVLVSMSLTWGCVRRPFPKPHYEEIRPNQTCYLIKLTGDTKTGQAKMDSASYAESDRVQVKRIEIPLVWSQEGRWDNDGKWIDGAKLVCLDRTPITRELTQNGATGTSPSNQAVQCESVESINFAMGITLTGSVPESGASKFLTKFSNKPLADVMDSNVRGFLVSHLCAEFAAMPLDNEYSWTVQKDKEDKPLRDEDGKIIKLQGELTRPGIRSQKLVVLTKVAESATKYFEEFGLELSNIGSSEGLSYNDPLIQAAINKAYTAKIDQETAGAERIAVMTRANTYAEAAKKRADADQYVNEKQARSLSELALKEMWIRKWDGHRPQVEGSGTPMIPISK